MNVIEYIECEVIELPELPLPDQEGDAGAAEAIWLSWFADFHGRPAAHQPQA